MTIASPHDAYVELRGRALALLVITLPYATLVTVLDDGDARRLVQLPEVLGLSFALLGAMLATGAWSSACSPFRRRATRTRPWAGGPRLDRHLRRNGRPGATVRHRRHDLADVMRTGTGGAGCCCRWGPDTGALITAFGLRMARRGTADGCRRSWAAVSKG